MQANWSLVLNVLLLIGVVVAITRLMKVRKQALQLSPAVAEHQPNLGKEPSVSDDIIAVRKFSEMREQAVVPEPKAMESFELEPMEFSTADKRDAVQSVMIFLAAKENRSLAGYELLQTVLAAGLRFGEGNLFHRHQYANGHGPILCSLAAATASGVFDLPNIGAFSTKGLCLFMQSSGNSTIDAERFNIMLSTAKQLALDLDSQILDDKQRPFTKDSLGSYCQRLQIKRLDELLETLDETC